ncbi:MAG: hypothetical protein M0030_23595 [Actinomycetota bacterium]|jgi:hypothetical protein|nr:hypothetical protein [Actinomycetota bacterium]
MTALPTAPGPATGIGARPGPATATPRRRRRLPAAAAGIVLVTIAIAAMLASRYQPIAYGGLFNSAELFPGLPPGHGIRAVNNLGGFSRDIYIPPQRGPFSLLAALRNDGPYPITIESVSLPAGGPVLAAPVRYSTPGMDGTSEIPPPVSRVLHAVRLGPGQTMFLGFLVRTSPCAQRNYWMRVPSFSVRIGFGPFTRTVPIPWGTGGTSLLLHEPGGHPGQPGTFCLPRAAQP